MKKQLASLAGDQFNHGLPSERANIVGIGHNSTPQKSPEEYEKLIAVQQEQIARQQAAVIHYKRKSKEQEAKTAAAESERDTAREERDGVIASMDHLIAGMMKVPNEK